MLKIWCLFYLVLLLRFSGTQSNGMVSTDTLGGVDALVVNNADNPTELLELVRKMSLELNRLTNEQRKKNAVIEELQETQKMLISSQSELENRIKDLEVEAKHFEIKVLLLRFSGTQSNGMVSTDIHVGVDPLAVNNADNPTELLELVRKMSLELIRLANEQRKKNAVIEELQETRKELLTSISELLKTQKKLISSQSELQNRIKDLEIEVKHFEIKDRMRRSAPSNVGFTARLTRSITSGLNSGQVLVFDNVYINVGNGYDATTGVFHAPVAGMYVILMTISSDQRYTSDDVEVVHNGELLCRAVAPHMNWGGCSCNAVVRLKVGDAVWVRETWSPANDFVRGEYFTTFSMGLMIKDDDGVSSF